MSELIKLSFSGPFLPATVLLVLVLFYWLLVILGASDTDTFDFDLDFEPDTSFDQILSVGFWPLKSLNLGQVPLMVWMSVFGLALWGLMIFIDRNTPMLTGEDVAWVYVRNVGLALLVTKLLTNPLRGQFDVVEPRKASELIGQTCEVTTPEVTELSGQAIYKTEAAPLLLNVRSFGDCPVKGDAVEIIEFDPVKNIYFVKLIEREASNVV